MTCLEELVDEHSSCTIGLLTTNGGKAKFQLRDQVSGYECLMMRCRMEGLTYGSSHQPYTTTTTSTKETTMKRQLPARIIIVAGTYDGVLAGWERDKAKEKNDDELSLEMTLATSVHQGSVRSLSLAGSGGSSSGSGDVMPGTLVSSGYDEMLRLHDWVKRLNSAGEVRTPADLGTPTCTAFCPPQQQRSTHCLAGFSNGKLAIYKKRDWSVHHILAGHKGGVSGLGVHPSGKLALSGGQTDGKVKLWDLTKGRLAYATNVVAEKRKHPVTSLVWNDAGTLYGWAYSSHITIRNVATGQDVMDIEVPSRVNQMVLLEGPQGTFCAAACNDGSLPVIQVLQENNEETNEKRAILAIEPVDGPVAGEERFKCIQRLYGYCVVTANSAGVVSVMDLTGAVNMLLSGDEDDDDQDEQDKQEQGMTSRDGGDDDNQGEDSDDDDDDKAVRPVVVESDKDDPEEEEEEELAVDILASVRLGSGARITCLAAWCSGLADQENKDEPHQRQEEAQQEGATKDNDDDKTVSKAEDQNKRKRPQDDRVQVEEELDEEALAKARELVSKAKIIDKERKEKRNNHKKTRKKRKQQ